VSRWIPVKNFVSNPTSRTRVYDTPPPPPLCHWRTGHGAQGTSTLRERETSLRTLRTLRERETSLRTRGLSSVTANACNKLWCIGCVVATAQHRIPVLIRLHLHLRICPYFIPYPSLSLSLSLSLSQTPLLPSGSLQHRKTSRCTSRPAQNQTGTCRHIHITQDSCYSHVPAAWDHWAHTQTHWGQSPAEGLTRRAFFFPQRSRPTVCDDGGCGQRWRDQRTLKTNVD
jgi:hypothetical protein